VVADVFETEQDAIAAALANIAVLAKASRTNET